MSRALRKAKRIPRASFVYEYVGELISDDDAEEHGNVSSTFHIGLESSDDKWCVDACRYANIASFINHSCEANIESLSLLLKYVLTMEPMFGFSRSSLLVSLFL